MRKNIVEIIWSVLCQESSIDDRSNNISLFKVLEQLKLNVGTKELDKLKDNPNFDPKKPIFLPFPFQLVILWKNLTSELDLEIPVKIVLKDPHKKIIQEEENNFLFKKGKKRLRTIVSMKGIPLTKSGEYVYHILAKQSADANFKEIGSIPLEVVINIDNPDW